MRLAAKPNSGHTLFPIASLLTTPRTFWDLSLEIRENLPKEVAEKSQRQTDSLESVWLVIYQPEGKSTQESSPRWDEAQSAEGERGRAKEAGRTQRWCSSQETVEWKKQEL